MILECGQCKQRYVVQDSAIGPDGRTVRCANCKHSWFQPGVGAIASGAAAAQPGAAATPTGSVRSDAAARIPPAADDFDPFAHRPPFRPRRDPAKRWTVMAIAAGLAMSVGVGAIIYTDTDGLARMIGLDIGSVDTPLKIVSDPIIRRDQDNGSELFAVSGKIVNPTNSTQPVPLLRAELRDAQGRIVFNWVIRPEKASLPPRSSVEFNSAMLDVPAKAEKLALSFGGDAG